MLAKVNSAALYGIDALLVEVEIDVAAGLPQLATVGLAEGAVRESKDRIRAAVKNCGYSFPTKKITINLAPADIKKEGSAYDLPMAVGILAAEGMVQKERLKDYLLAGELSLDGEIKPIRGGLPIAVVGRKAIEIDGKKGGIQQGVRCLDPLPGPMSQMLYSCLLYGQQQVFSVGFKFRPVIYIVRDRAAYYGGRDNCEQRRQTALQPGKVRDSLIVQFPPNETGRPTAGGSLFP